ncbi:MAG: DNA translocase FtsK 4TM domain-containing protein [Thermoguttaceae bacterium]
MNAVSITLYYEHAIKMNLTPRRRVGGYILLAVVAACVVFLAGQLWSLLGVSMFVVVVALVGVAVTLMRDRNIDQPLLRLIGTLLITVAVSGLATTFAPPESKTELGAGGWLGAMMWYGAASISPNGATWFFLCCAVAGIVLAADDIVATIAIACFRGGQVFTRHAREHAPKFVDIAQRIALRIAKRIDVPARFRTAKDWSFARFDALRTHIEKLRTRRAVDVVDEVDTVDNVNDVYTLSRPPRVLGGGLEDTAQADAVASFAQANSEATGEEEVRVEEDVDEVDTVDIVDEALALGPRRLRGGDDVDAEEVSIAEEVCATEDVCVTEEVCVAEEPQVSIESTTSTPSTQEEAPPEEEVVASEKLPPLDSLTASEPFNVDEYESAVLEQADKLQQAFADFGFKIDVTNIQTGPVIGQFEIQLEKGLRLSKITSLTDDLAIALKVQTVRIVAPIPGRNTVGVEIPNAHRRVVRLRDVMEQSAAATAKMAIPVFLGQDATGQPLVADLAKLPHLLIAGRTGTGKSVCLNSIIVSILMTRRSEEVRMLMIDPKMVELSPYKTIPHLMHPVVTDMRKAEAILGWAVEKMEDRYRLLARAGVRQLSEYNRLTEQQLYKRTKPESDTEWNNIPKSMPYVVIVADELADLMMTAGKEVESHIIRLAQKSRAVGIHLVLATQKPTVDIITGLIKSNLPARIAFQVASRTDSQVVLDRNGAEKLLGNGDMLFLQPGTSLVERGQGTYVSDEDIERVIELVSLVPQEFAAELVALEVDAQEAAVPPPKETRDAIYEQAVECIINEGKGSVSLLQRKLEIGYGRAARIIDAMETDGIVGPSQGAQPREVLMTLSQWRYQTTGHAAPEVTLPPEPEPEFVEPEPEAFTDDDQTDDEPIDEQPIDDDQTDEAIDFQPTEDSETADEDDEEDDSVDEPSEDDEEEIYDDADEDAEVYADEECADDDANIGSPSFRPNGATELSRG